jgi:hypothetical protein
MTRINTYQSYILIHLVCLSVNLGHGRELGTDWVCIEHGLSTNTGGTGHGIGGLGTGELDPGEGRNTGRLDTGRHDTNGLDTN